MISDTISLAVFMANCSFQVEIDKSTINESLLEIEKHLDDSFVNEEPDTRIFEVMQNALAISISLSNDEIESVAAITELSFAFLYTYTKQVGKISDEVKGIVGLLTDEYVNFNTCVSTIKYQKIVDNTKKFYEDVMGSNLLDKTPPKPTLH